MMPEQACKRQNEQAYKRTLRLLYPLQKRAGGDNSNVAAEGAAPLQLR